MAETTGSRLLCHVLRLFPYIIRNMNSVGELEKVTMFFGRITWRRLLAGVMLGLWAMGAWGGEVVLGVLSYRPKPETLARWQPTVDYLAGATGQAFRLEAMTYPELELAVQQRRLDFVLTNPAHYVQMSAQVGMSSPLATLIESEMGQPMSQFGGVVLTRADRADIKTLTDLRNKVVSTPDVGSFGGYQMQAYELHELGLDPARDMAIRVTGMPHDTALAALLKGEVDAAFVRTGVLEALVEAGRVDRADLKVVGARLVPGFPFLHSTRLYPEWLIAVMPQVDPRLAQEVAKALFSMDARFPAVQAGQYYGWSIPMDYGPVRRLMQALRLPPYDAAPEFTWRDVLQRHGFSLVLAGMAVALILSLLFLLVARNRELAESELRFRQFADNSRVVVWVRTARDMLYISKAYEILWGRSRESLYAEPNSFVEAVHEQDRERVIRAFQRELEETGSFDEEYRVVRPDGSICWIHARSFPVRDSQGRVIRSTGVAEDITDRKAADDLLRQKLEERRQLLAALGEGVYGIDLTGRCTFVNPAALAMLGYSQDEMLGQDTHALVHHHHGDGRLYDIEDCPTHQTMADGVLRRHESTYFRRDGTRFQVEMTAASLDRDGQRIGAVVVFHDISERKQMEAELQALATTDALTGLPNRRQFLSLLEREVARLCRFGESVSSLLMIDLDFFKQVNDLHGHAAGDAVLRHFGQLVKDSLRRTDQAGRLGGEEFALLLFGTDGEDATEFADRLRERVAAEEIPYGDLRLHITISIGVTTLREEDGQVDASLARADTALYQAKTGGRNRVAYL
jgi:diguanylate cyclase (GGDEF)-like protein/PAS domain S-box-containing protein